MRLEKIHRRIKASNYKPWQVYLLTASTLGGLGLYFNVGIITSALRTIERASSGLEWLVILGIQGVLIGFVAESLYEQGNRYAKAASHLFGSKDRTLFFRIGVMTVVSGIITKVIPSVLERATEYFVIQTAGAVIALGIFLIHQGSRNWNIQTEWPAIVAGAILAIAPSLV
ncbi:uncharacterized protein HHUB_3502 [Halobacterium hubeiense]|uniref:Uncharacterized protein n=1 Tax=Halobacterium hubeiense TaxID=1407499 RepID=A0A0U5H5Q2_9EURY|nr:hypothetical protein [Halobacterium hubeiense]CQH61621.1 uncharacterized protein HHUB_3502 [Halobacterium hubeiense]